MLRFKVLLGSDTNFFFCLYLFGVEVLRMDSCC